MAGAPITRDDISGVQIQSTRVEPIQIVVGSTIFFILLLISMLMLSILSIVTTLLGGSIMFYHLMKARSVTYSNSNNNRKSPSIFLVMLLILPLILGTIIAYDGYSVGMSILRVIIIWGFAVNFWSVMLFIPLAVYNKHKEQTQFGSNVLPLVSIIVPAYNEEKVIDRTIKSLLNLDYSKKEIIVVDDGSEDQTLEIAKRYKGLINVLHKENGGKAYALNYGISHAKGEIIVVVDADTILRKDVILPIVRTFATNGNVAAVGGNVKVRNRVNWITWCQALEYITGINIMRRAFDILGAINMVPGALGAFNKSRLASVGSYSNDTVVEDFDLTVRLSKAGYAVHGNNAAISLTEAPQTLRDFYLQRKRWYRGNLQVVSKHFDAMTNPSYGFLHRIVFPFMVISMLVLPVIGISVVFSSIASVLLGDGIFVLVIFALFIILQHLQSTLAVWVDGDDPKLIAYSLFAVVGYKQIIDILLIQAAIATLFKRKPTWTRSQRFGSENIVEKSNKAWKCYRCDLTFKEESHAFVHTDISNHSTQQIELI
ncbi:MAG: glycosyltransferase [Marine Group I thaumarchaeote]|nr:MAG: glycosyltransferase [Marine Group I thaumarchaeote]